MPEHPDHAELHYGNKVLKFPVTVGTENEAGIDISTLRKDTGAITLDPGFVNTGSCESAITYIDGEKGILRHAGIPIEELCEQSTFLEVTYLLLFGELPTKDALDEFTSDIRCHTMLHEDVKGFFSAFPKRAHPMMVSAAVISALSTFYPGSMDPTDEKQREISTARILAKLPTIAAYAYKHSIGQPFMYPRNRLDYASNFLHMMFATPTEDYEIDPVVSRALDKLLILHADHEQNCSTSTVRMVGSSGANMFASLSAGFLALWGPKHGGANSAVVEMLQRIHDSGDGGRKYMQMVKEQKSGIRLMGFGHRVYKSYDPRATILKKTTYEVLEKLKLSNPLLDVAVELEEVALKDSYFVERNLYPNVDFYSGLIYQAMGIPVDMFPLMFALGRTPGWIAQWREMHNDPAARIARPRQVYTGPAKRAYVPLEKRSPRRS